MDKFMFEALIWTTFTMCFILTIFSIALNILWVTITLGSITIISLLIIGRFIINDAVGEKDE